MKNVIIIHGCPSDEEKAMDPKTRTYDKHWIQWIKKELIARGIKTETPLMPSPWEPNYEKFKKEFEKYNVDEDTILIGHSCGCAFLSRWLGETKKKIKKLILVAPWKIPDKNDKIQKEFYDYPIDESIKSRVKWIVMFASDNEEEDGKKSLKIFHRALDGKIIELKGRGHYTLEDMGTEEFPELLKEAIMKTIFVDAINAFVIKGEGIFEEMHKMLEGYPNRKIILTNADDEEIEKFGLKSMPYEVFTLKHNPNKTDSKYFDTMLKHFGLKASDVVYFEHNADAVKSAQSIGITTFYYDKDKRDLVTLKKFIDENL
ncbi:MAG: alpha/beta hydrolase [Nanoarchaeota archaeon]|nr:alpha/beta hydrolase [Nanoarchaeota archaeon]